jgi:hypothetical protein
VVGAFHPRPKGACLTVDPAPAGWHSEFQPSPQISTSAAITEFTDRPFHMVHDRASIAAIDRFRRLAQSQRTRRILPTLRNSRIPGSVLCASTYHINSSASLRRPKPAWQTFVIPVRTSLDRSPLSHCSSTALISNVPVACMLSDWLALCVSTAPDASHKYTGRGSRSVITSIDS